MTVRPPVHTAPILALVLWDDPGVTGARARAA